MSDSYRLPIDNEAFIRDSMKPTASGGGTVVGSHGDMMYQRPTGLGAVPATLGSGYMVMVSRGVGFAPVMIDLLDLISFVTGGESIARLVAFSVVLPSLSGSGVVSSATAASGTGSLSVILAAISGSGTVSSGTPASGAGSLSVVLPSISGSGVVIP